jgi:NitT/TauT family transport system substrate-binding protein
VRKELTRGIMRTIVAGLCIGVAACAWGQTKIRIGVISSNESQLPIRIAISEGYFREQNIEVEPVGFRGGGVAVQALAGGSIELCACATDHVARMVDKGFDARILIGIDRFITSLLVVPAASPYTDIRSLRGKKIGVSAPGSYSDNTTRWAIKQAGLDPDRDFVIIGTGQGASGKAALESGQIDALTSSTPDWLDNQFSTPKRYRILADWRNIPHSGQAVIARQRWVDANPAAAKGVFLAAGKALRVIQSNPKVAERVLKTMFPEQSDAYIHALEVEVAPRMSVDGRISAAGFQKMIEIMQVVEPGLKEVKLSEVDLFPALSK